MPYGSVLNVNINDNIILVLLVYTCTLLHYSIIIIYNYYANSKVPLLRVYIHMWGEVTALTLRVYLLEL